MRIRKNRTSSRMTPEFCVSHALEQLVSIKCVDAAAAKIDPAPPPVLLLEPSDAMKKKQQLEVDELQLDAAAILNSLDNESSSYKIKIRDFVLAHGGNARSGGSENHDSTTRSRQSGSESDTGHATGSRKRMIGKQQHVYNSEQPKLSESEKMNSDSSSKAMGEEIESAHEHAFAKSEVIDDHLPPQPTTTTAVADSKSVVGSRKRFRRQVESDSSMQVQEKEDYKEEEEYKYPAAAFKAIPEKTAAKFNGKKENMMLHQQEKEITEKVPTASSFPEGWSYRGLAQIAENEKANQGKQCGRTDGRSWRCPLKVQEGFTLCEHHLSKFRLKKLCKGNKKQKPSPKHCRPQQLLQKQQTPPSPPSPTPSPPPSPPQIDIAICKTTQTPTSLEHDVPTKFRRRHKTVKLSVL